MARSVGLIALSIAASAVAAPVASAAIPPNDEWVYRILSAKGTITFTASGEWFDGFTRDLDGNPLNTKGTITIVNSWRMAKATTQILPLRQLRRFPGPGHRMAIRGVVGTSSAHGSGTTGDGVALTCNATVPLTRRFFSDSAVNDMFLRTDGRGTRVSLYLRGGYPTYPAGESTVSPDCGRIIDGVGMKDADEKRPTAFKASFFRRKRGGVFSFVVTQSMPLRAAKIDGQPIVGSVTWRSTFKLRVKSFS